jgi:hypothetical protein
MSSRFFIDELGRLWFKIDWYRVFNDEVGYGGWYDGEGLIPLPNSHRIKV